MSDPFKLVRWWVCRIIWWGMRMLFWLGEFGTTSRVSFGFWFHPIISHVMWQYECEYHFLNNNKYFNVGDTLFASFILRVRQIKNTTKWKKLLLHLHSSLAQGIHLHPKFVPLLSILWFTSQYLSMQKINKKNLLIK